MNQKEARYNIGILLKAIKIADDIMEKQARRGIKLLKYCSFREIWNNFSRSNQRL